MCNKHIFAKLSKQFCFFHHHFQIKIKKQDILDLTNGPNYRTNYWVTLLTG